MAESAGVVRRLRIPNAEAGENGAGVDVGELLHVLSQSSPRMQSSSEPITSLDSTSLQGVYDTVLGSK